MMITAPINTRNRRAGFALDAGIASTVASLLPAATSPALPGCPFFRVEINDVNAQAVLHFAFAKIM